MGIGIAIGNRIGASGGKNWVYHWTHSNLFLFFGETKYISGGRLNNQIHGATDYLTVAGVAGSETYQAPHTATYETADTDYIWFKTDSTQRTTTTAELIGYDFARTLVKYDNISPYSVRWIAILKPTTAVTNAMRDSFDLSIWWDNTLSFHGKIKDNRGTGQNVWSLYDAESLTLFARMTTTPTNGLKVAIDDLIKGLKNGGTPSYWSRIDCLQKYNLLATDQIVLNWKANQWNATLVNIPVFIAKSGIKTNVGLTAYVNTGFKPSDGVNFQLNNCSWFNGLVALGGTNTAGEGCFSAVTASLVYMNENYSMHLNGSAYVDATEQLQVGYNILTRSGASTSRSYNGIWQANTATSIARPDNNMFALTWNNNGVPTVTSILANKINKGQLMGAYFTDAECDAIRILLETFDTKVATL